MDWKDALATQKILPIVTLERASDAPHLAEAFKSAGMNAVEVTLRTKAGMASIPLFKQAGMNVGAGTVLTPDQVMAAREAGADFAVSPGWDPRLAQAIRMTRWPWMPAVATPSEVMRARDAGWTRLKFFPAEVMGGTAMLKQLGAVFPDIAFCPTGGVSEANMKEYLALPNVWVIGGSWLAPAADLKTKQWERIALRCQAAMHAR